MKFVSVLIVLASACLVMSAPQKKLDFNPKPDNTPPFRLDGGGSHSKAGTNIYLDGERRVWQSQNRNNEVHLGGSYGQHFGGPSGRSPPSFGGHATYVHRF